MVIYYYGFIFVTGVEGVELTIQNYKKKKFLSAELGFFSFTLNLKKFKPKFPKRVTITARKNGYIFSIKHVDIADESTDEVRNIEIVLFKRPEPITFNTSDGVQLDTPNAVNVRVPANTEFEDENGNVVTGSVNAVFYFISPASRDFENSPGEFITDTNVQLMSFGLFVASFEDMDGAPLKPRGQIDVENADPDVKDMRLYRMTANGQWEELPAVGARRKRQAKNDSFIGSFGPGEVDGWLNIDKPAVQKRCYMKMRVFEDNTFSTEVTDGQDLTVTPKVLLKVYVGSSVLGLNLNPAGTDSPGQHCYTVRCTDIAPIKGEIMLYERRTDIDSFSLTQPVPANNPNLPPDLPALEYTVDANAKRARLRFDASAAGPLFEDENVCQLAPKEKSLWFALGPAQSPGGNFGDDVCVMRVRVMIKSDQNNESQSNPLASLNVLSNWGISDEEIDYDIVDANEMVPIPIPSEYAFAACARYECSKTDTPTTVAFLPTPVADTVSCHSGQTLEPPVIDSDGDGYYYGTDEDIVKATCKASGPSNPYVNTVVCS